MNPIYKAAELCCESEHPSPEEVSRTIAVLEDANSPMASKYMEKLYDSVVSKGHIDFDDIPTSKGDIGSYKKLPQLQSTIDAILQLAREQNNKQVQDMANQVITGINNLRRLAPQYTACFQRKIEYGVVEYNTYVYTIIQATSAILYDYVEYLKRPGDDVMTITLKNTTARANKFYYEHLMQINSLTSKPDYQRYLDSIINNGREGFLGYTVLGIGAVVGMGLAMIPITRELVYQFYHMRTKVSDCFEQQAYFLDMNKTVIESNNALNVAEKEKILRKQEALRSKLLRISGKLKVGQAQGSDNSKRALAKDNKLMKLNVIKNEVNEPKSVKAEEPVMTPAGMPAGSSTDADVLQLF